VFGTEAGDLPSVGLAARPARHNLALQVADGEVTAYLDGVPLTTYSDSTPRLSGRVNLRPLASPDLLRYGIGQGKGSSIRADGKLVAETTLADPIALTCQSTHTR
jgi:hypothetical protein